MWWAPKIWVAVLSAVYRYEFGVDVTEGGNWESNRPKYVGLKGGFGTLTLGTQDTPITTSPALPIFSIAAKPSSIRSGWGWFFAQQQSQRRPGRSRPTVEQCYYSTPDFNGFSGQAMLVMDGASEDVSDDVDIWNLAALYNNGPFFAGVSYIKLEGKNNIPPRPH